MHDFIFFDFLVALNSNCLEFENLNTKRKYLCDCDGSDSLTPRSIQFIYFTAKSSAALRKRLRALCELAQGAFASHAYRFVRRA